MGIKKTAAFYFLFFLFFIGEAAESTRTDMRNRSRICRPTGFIVKRAQLISFAFTGL
jgi:hypothetical protein